MAPSLTDLDFPAPQAWDRLLERASTPVRFFHTAAATSAMVEAFPEYEDRRCHARFDDGTELLIPLILARRRTRSLSALRGLPLSWPGTPLVLAGRLDAGKLAAILRESTEAGELHVFGGGLPGEVALDGDEESETHLLDLAGGFSHVWEHRMSGRARNMGRKAEHAGLRVEHVDPIAAMDHFHRLYVGATRDWGYATPPYPRSLFEALARSEGVELALASAGDQPVAGTISLRGAQDLFQWSTVMDRGHRDAAPTNGLLAHVIEDACARGFRWYDMGSSRGLPGVASFKESFGATRVAFRDLRIRTTGNRIATACTRLIHRARRPTSGEAS